MSITEALPQLMFALATGQNPNDATKPWAGMEAKEASRTADDRELVVSRPGAAAAVKAKKPAEHGKNTYWEDEEEPEEEVSKYTGVAVYKKKEKKVAAREVGVVDPTTVGGDDYSRAQAERDAALLADTGRRAAGGAGAPEPSDDA